MKKTFTSAGVNGTFSGYVEVIFNYRQEVKEVHNPSTHDEEKRTIVFGIIRGFANGTEVATNEFRDGNFSVQALGEVEAKVADKLKKIADQEIQLTAEQKLAQRGYR